MLPRVALALVVVVTALLVELTILTALPLPGATPDLLLLGVIALALSYGPLAGAGIGFAAGLTLDLVPPADSAVGRWAFVLCLVGYLAGLAREVAERSVFMPLLIVALAAAGTALLYGGLGLLLGDTRVTWPLLAALLPTAVVYNVVLALVVLPLVLRFAHRLEPGLARR